MIRDILSKFINNLPPKPKYQGELSLLPNNILGITLLSIEEAEELPIEIRNCGKWYWLKDKGDYSSYVAVVDYDGDVFNYGSYVHNDNYTVRPILLTNLKSDNLQLYDIYNIFDINWYYIGDGKFFVVKPIGLHRFNDNPYNRDYLANKISYNEYLSLFEKAEINNYDKSEIKEFLENWLEEKLQTL